MSQEIQPTEKVTWVDSLNIETTISLIFTNMESLLHSIKTNHYFKSWPVIHLTMVITDTISLIERMYLFFRKAPGFFCFVLFCFLVCFVVVKD